jgi:hypothetical protein
MNIQRTNNALPIQYTKQQVSQRQTAQSSPAMPIQDQVNTSKQTLTLSRSMAKLKNMSQPRDEVIQKFKGDIDSPMTFSDDVIKSIMGEII